MSEIQEPEIFEVVRKLRYTLTAGQSLVTTMQNMLAALSWPIPGKVECARCGVYLAGPLALEDHLVNVHGDKRCALRVETPEVDLGHLSTAANPARVERSRAIENDENSRGIR